MRIRIAVLVLLIAAIGTTGALLARDQGPEGQVQTKTTVTKRQVDPAEKAKFAASPGWEWLMYPQALRVGESFGQSSEEMVVTGYSHVEAQGGGLRFFIAKARPPKDPLDELGVKYRLVIFDADGRRYLPVHPGNTISKGNGNRTTLVNYSLFSLRPEVLPPEKATHVGFECMIP